MILPYYLRLLCLCLATFFVAHTLAWAIVRSMSGVALRVAENMKPRSSSRLLFGLRIAPASLSLFMVAGFCVPSYLWLEPHITGERVGWLCLTAALLGASAWAVAIVRGMNAVVRTERYVGRIQCANTDHVDVVVVNDATAIMAMAGVMQPKLVVSKSILAALSEGQKEAAFRHEAAHRSSHDNLKRLMFLLSPDVVPFVAGLAGLERGWMKFTEWAADDDAVDGDQDRALSLASALVLVAKLGVRSAPAYVLSSLMDDGSELETR